MRILGIDTAIPTASVALVENGEIIAEVVEGESVQAANDRGAPKIGNHAESIVPLIQSVLDKAQIGIQGLSGISLSIGPGSFTGLRIGLATVKGLAYDTGLPVVGISTLESQAARLGDIDGLIGVLLDARKAEVYAAMFRRSATALTRLGPDVALSLPSAIELIKQICESESTSVVLFGTGAEAYRRPLLDALGDYADIVDGSGKISVAAAVAELAAPRFASGSVDDIGALEPLYLRLSEAENKRAFLL